MQSELDYLRERSQLLDKWIRIARRTRELPADQQTYPVFSIVADLSEEALSSEATVAV